MAVNQHTFLPKHNLCPKHHSVALHSDTLLHYTNWLLVVHYFHTLGWYRQLCSAYTSNKTNTNWRVKKDWTHLNIRAKESKNAGVDQHHKTWYVCYHKGATWMTTGLTLLLFLGLSVGFLRSFINSFSSTLRNPDSQRHVKAFKEDILASSFSLQI